MLNLNMFGPTPPTPSGGGAPMIILNKDEGGRYNKPRKEDDLIKENNEKIAILITNLIISNN